MPKQSKVARCVRKVKRQKGKRNAYAVCQAATGQSYKTGKRIRKASSRGR